MDKQPQEEKGKFLGMPYDLRPLDDEERYKEQERESENHGIFMPKRFGWGYTINFEEVTRRIKHLFR